MDSETDYLFKIIVIGSSGVGKSSLLRRYVDGSFYEDTCSTIGVDYMIKTLNVSLGGISKLVKLQLWDTAGQERFQSITTNYLRGAHAVILMFSLHEPETFSKMNQWIALLDNCKDALYFLIGNKADLDKGQVKQDIIDTFCQDYQHLTYIKTSAKTGENIEALFVKMAFELVQKQVKKIEENKSVLRLTEKKKEEDEKEVKRKCCGGT